MNVDRIEQAGDDLPTLIKIVGFRRVDRGDGADRLALCGSPDIMPERKRLADAQALLAIFHSAVLRLETDRGLSSAVTAPAKTKRMANLSGASTQKRSCYV